MLKIILTNLKIWAGLKIQKYIKKTIFNCDFGFQTYTHYLKNTYFVPIKVKNQDNIFENNISKMSFLGYYKTLKTKRNLSIILRKMQQFYNFITNLIEKDLTDLKNKGTKNISKVFVFRCSINFLLIIFANKKLLKPKVLKKIV